MSRFVSSAVVAAAVAAAFAVPSAAFAGCYGYGCYAPPPQPCATCYQQQVIPPQYRTVYDNVMVSPGGVIPHHVPPRYATVMVPRTVMVEPERVYHERIPPRFATVPRVEMVTPPQTVMVPVAPRCNNCGGLFGNFGSYGY